MFFLVLASFIAVSGMSLAHQAKTHPIDSVFAERPDRPTRETEPIKKDKMKYVTYRANPRQGFKH